MYLSLGSFGSVSQEKAVQYTLGNNAGTRLSMTDYGARITDLIVTDRWGDDVNIVLGLADAGEYARDTNVMGALCVRTGDFVDRRLEDGFDRQLWKVDMSPEGLTFSRTGIIPGGEVTVRSTVSVSEENDIRFLCEAEATAPVSLHLLRCCYFNLDGRQALGATHHRLKVNAVCYIPYGADAMPADKVLPVRGTALDFTEFTHVGNRLYDPLVRDRGGYDHCFLLDGEDAAVRPACELIGEEGRRLVLETNLPALRLYTANRMADPHRGIVLAPEVRPGRVLQPGQTVRTEVIWHIREGKNVL